MSISCPVCQKENRDQAKFCVHCGENFASYHPCPSCHALSRSSKFCTACGQKMEAPAPQATAGEAMLPVPAAQALLATAPEPPLAPASIPVPVPVPETVFEPAPEVAPESQPEPVPESEPAPKSAPVSSPVPAREEKGSASNPNGTGAKSTPNLLVSGVLVAALLAGGAYWFVSKDKATDPDLVATTPSQAPVVQVAPSPAPQAAASAAPTEEPAPVPVAVPVTPPADQPKAEVPPAKLAVVKKKPAEKKTPESLPVTPVQSAFEAPPVKVDTPLPPKQIARTLDETLNARVAAECAKGFSGLLCREKIRFSVCDGKWSESPPPGQTACKGTGTT